MNNQKFNLINAETAKEISFNNMNDKVKDTLEKINTRIINRANEGYISACYYIDGQSEIRDVVKKELVKAGYKCTTSYNDEHVIEIEW